MRQSGLDEDRWFELDEYYLLDTETTGLYGAVNPHGPTDVVVDIGIVKVDLRRRTVKEVFSSVVGYETDEWDEYRRNAWIFENTDMTLEMVREAPRAEYVIPKVQRLLRDRIVTSYNVAYDFGKFLDHSPWNIRQYGVIVANDPMLAATKVCKIKSEYYGREYRYPKLDYAYSKILEGEDPAGIDGVQDHRALSDAKMAAYLSIRMHDNGDYELFAQKPPATSMKPESTDSFGFSTYGRQ